MPDFVTLSCPTCGGQLQITKDIDRFACAHCGNEHVVNRGGGIVTLAPVVAGLERIQRGTDRTAAELTIRRLKEEIDEAEREMLTLARRVCLSDYRGMHAELIKLELWRDADWSLRGGNASNPDAVRYRQEFIVGLSADAMAELSQRLQKRFRVLKLRSDDVAAFETMISLKRQVEKSQSQIEKYRRELDAAD